MRHGSSILIQVLVGMKCRWLSKLRRCEGIAEAFRHCDKLPDCGFSSGMKLSTLGMMIPSALRDMEASDASVFPKDC